MYLGLDISTSIIGICFFDTDGNFVSLNSLDLRKTKCIFDKANLFRAWIKNILKDKEVEKIGIEENLQSFRSGMSSAKTILTLGKFNGVVSQILHEETSLKPEYISVHTARKLNNLRLDRTSKNNIKEQVFLQVKDEINYNWPTKIISRGKNKGVVKMCDECYDMCDAYIITKALVKLINGNKL